MVDIYASKASSVGRLSAVCTASVHDQLTMQNALDCMYNMTMDIYPIYDLCRMRDYGTATFVTLFPQRRSSRSSNPSWSRNGGL